MHPPIDWSDVRVETGRQSPQRQSPKGMGRGFAVLVSILFVSILFWPSPSAAVADDDRDFEPVPPQIFWPTPDEHYAPIIRALIANSFADQNKAPFAREQLVWMYHLWSIPALVEELSGSNHSGITNSALTIAALRDRRGPATEFWDTLAPLIKVADADSMDPWQRAVACLALGCFHWLEGVDRDRQQGIVDPLTSDRVGRVHKWMKTAERVLRRRIRDDNAQVRAAALVAFAKRGGDGSLQRLNESYDAKMVAEPTTRWAHLLALGFLGESRIDPFFNALDDDSRRLQRAASLAMSVGMLIDRPPDWTTNSDVILKRLERVPLGKTEGPEAVFARGVCTWKYQKILDWKKLWDIAVQPRGEPDIALAAAQMLLFCEERWILDAAIKVAAGKSGSRVREPVLAMCLLHAGRRGTPQGIDAAHAWLSNPGKTPRAESTGWDVRFHAAIGLLRALREGRIEDETLRARAIEALQNAVKKGMAKDAPCRLALERVLEEEAPKILANKSNRLSKAGLDAVENSFQCKYGLLARDPIDACVHRVNLLVQDLWSLRNLTSGAAGAPKKDQQAQLYLKSYLDRYPYFSRLEFRHERGWRRAVVDSDDPMVFDR